MDQLHKAKVSPPAGRARSPNLTRLAMCAVLITALAIGLFGDVASAHRNGRSHGMSPNQAAKIGFGSSNYKCRWDDRCLIVYSDIQSDGHCIALKVNGRSRGRWSCGQQREMYIKKSELRRTEVCITGHWRCRRVWVDYFY